MRTWNSLLLTACLTALAACASSSETRATTADTYPANCPFASISDAIAVIGPTRGTNSHVSGTVRFTQVEGGCHVVADIDGLKPNAKHGFHVHELGDITGDGKTVGGGHYNPGGHQHGAPDAPMHHAGDLGNLETDDKGHAHYDRVIAGMSVARGGDPVLGRSVLVHAGEDDLATQPTGNAGERIGCGVIGVAKPAAK